MASASFSSNCLFGLPAMALALSACSGAKTVKQSDLDAISDKCGLPRSALQLRDNGQLRFQPSPDSKYEAVHCVFAEIKRLDMPGMKVGFVGNEKYEAEPDNAPNAGVGR